MDDTTTGRWQPTRRTWLVGGLLAVLATLLVVASATTIAWGNSLRDERRLLPGTLIASVDVGQATVEEAEAAVEAHLADRLDRVVEVTYNDRTWSTTARELGATTDVDAAVADALRRTTEAGFGDLLRMRWLGGEVGDGLDVAMQLPDGAVEDLVATIADDLDRGPRDAEVAWSAGAFEVTEDRAGREVDQAEATELLTAAFSGGGDDPLPLPVDRIDPDVTTDLAEQVATDATAVVDQALDHAVTVALEGDERRVTPRELGATPDADPLLAAAFAHAQGDGPAPSVDDVDLDVPADELSGFVESLASGKGVAARDAELDLSGGRFEITPERTGSSLDREDARAKVRSALGGASDRVDLELATVRPAVTRDSFDRVLVVRQSERTLQLYRNGEVSREWPVAVGTGDHPTPTGQFTVGAKRFEPTWVNPSPNGWGSSMPASIGPGPDNPLGVRAINWNRNGADTLIRFHGTPNEDSIGQAASKGCIRMFNRDVIELYDLVPTGTVIISMN